MIIARPVQPGYRSPAIAASMATVDAPIESPLCRDDSVTRTYATLATNPDLAIASCRISERWLPVYRERPATTHDGPWAALYLIALEILQRHPLLGTTDGAQAVPVAGEAFTLGFRIGAVAFAASADLGDVDAETLLQELVRRTAVAQQPGKVGPDGLFQLLPNTTD